MSILSEPFATPSRVQGVYRLLLHSKGQRMKREDLEHLISPLSLNSEEKKESDWFDMVRKVVNETMKMGLVKKDGDEILLSDQLPKVLKDRTKGDYMLPLYITDLILSDENKENHDFARLLAWYLAQDVYEAPGNWREVEQLLHKQVGPQLFGCNSSTRFDMFKYWSRFCGFTWQYHLDGSRLTPDPTVYFLRLLPDLFSDMQTLEFEDIVLRIAKRCPVMENGVIRKELEQEYDFENRENRHLSSVTSHAWLRLEAESHIKLHLMSDAPVYVLKEGQKQHRYSHITWIKKKERS